MIECPQRNNAERPSVVVYNVCVATTNIPQSTRHVKPLSTPVLAGVCAMFCRILMLLMYQVKEGAPKTRPKNKVILPKIGNIFPMPPGRSGGSRPAPLLAARGGRAGVALFVTLKMLAALRGVRFTHKAPLFLKGGFYLKRGCAPLPPEHVQQINDRCFNSIMIQTLCDLLKISALLILVYGVRLATRMGRYIQRDSHRLCRPLNVPPHRLSGAMLCRVFCVLEHINSAGLCAKPIAQPRTNIDALTLPGFTFRNCKTGF